MRDEGKAVVERPTSRNAGPTRRPYCRRNGGFDQRPRRRTSSYWCRVLHLEECFRSRSTRYHTHSPSGIGFSAYVPRCRTQVDDRSMHAVDVIACWATCCWPAHTPPPPPRWLPRRFERQCGDETGDRAPGRQSRPGMGPAAMSRVGVPPPPPPPWIDDKERLDRTDFDGNRSAPGVDRYYKTLGSIERSPHQFQIV